MGPRIRVARARASFTQVVPQVWDPLRQVRDPGTTADYAAWYVTVLPRHLTIPEEAWVAGIHPPVEVWHGAERRARAVALGPDPEDPFDGIPHDGQGAPQAQGPRPQGPVQAAMQPPRAERDAARAERDEARGWCVTAIVERDEARAHIVTLLSEWDQAQAQAGPGDDRVAWRSQI
ncbi:hypothetical protein KI387_041834 [Taxus chinensis]|uniref:Uncharacterized protein n=1 Tax=Taxus chinensis TaxID=29808 RepID=A0AA38C559_TAXCH|nr:hypothetical protein KI387_041834 [Taxus chinensis]